MIKNEDFILIESFMVSELNLKGNKLLIYALIYKYTQATDNLLFRGGLQHMVDWTNSTKQGVQKALKELKRDGLLIPVKEGKRVLYKTKKQKENNNAL